MSNLETALSYLEKNYSVVPVWSPSLIKKDSLKFTKKLKKAKEKNSSLETPKSDEEITKKALIGFCKKPCIKTWKEYQKRLPTKEEVTAWFTKYPDANIGIITGEVSNLVVFDLDSDKAKKYAEDRGGFPQTITARSSKEDRYHKYMKYPGIKVKNNVSEKLDIDIRGDGGLIVAPPSIHGSGVQYKWEEDFSPEDIEPAECAPWMVDYLKSIAESEKPTERKVESDQSKNTTEEKKNEDNKYVKIIREGFIHGERNTGTIGFLGHLFKTKLKPEEIWEMAKIWNMKNKPPIDLDELRTIFNSAKKMEKESQMDINSFLYDPNKTSAEYEKNFVRIPFAGNNLTNLEENMNGGLIGGNLYILGGIPSSGKTATINNIADNICLNGQPVLFFSYDDTSIRTNLLFFEKGKPTKDIWYFEHPLPDGYKTYGKTKPMRIEEFQLEKKWWSDRDNEDYKQYCWNVTIGEIKKRNYNLDINNPNNVDETEHMSSKEIIGLLEKSMNDNVEILEKIKRQL